jgi:hypothetical protein
MRKMSRYNELVLLRLKNEDQMLQLVESNVQIECDLTKLEFEEKLKSTPVEILKEMRAFYDLPESVANSILASIESETLERLQGQLKTIDAAFEVQINEIKKARKDIALQAQQIISTKAPGDVESNGSCGCAVCEMQDIIKEILNPTKGKMQNKREGDCETERNQLEALLRRIASNKTPMIFKL